MKVRNKVIKNETETHPKATHVAVINRIIIILIMKVKTANYTNFIPPMSINYTVITSVFLTHYTPTL